MALKEVGEVAVVVVGTVVATVEVTVSGWWTGGGCLSLCPSVSKITAELLD